MKWAQPLCVNFWCLCFWRCVTLHDYSFVDVVSCSSVYFCVFHKENFTWPVFNIHGYYEWSFLSPLLLNPCLDGWHRNSFSLFLFFCQLKQRKILVIIMLIALSALINLCNSNNFSYQPCGHGGNFIFTVSYQWLSSFWRTTAILFPSCKFAIVTAQYSTWKE